MIPRRPQAADDIKWGVLIDLSGPTSDWGKNQVKGQLDAMRWVNENGGINGKELKLIVIDDGYDTAKGVAGYNRLVDSEKVMGLYIQSTGTTITLAKKIVADGVATIAASFTSKFQNPAKTPFSFFVSPSYGTMGRIALKWIKDNWKDKSRNPKICYLYPDNTYGRDILDVCKDYAKTDRRRCGHRPGHQLAHQGRHGSAHQHEPRKSGFRLHHLHRHERRRDSEKRQGPRHQDQIHLQHPQFRGVA